MQEFETAILILNYNGKKHLEKFLPSVIENNDKAHIYLIDNASTDDSIQFIEN
jgi:GT2 family glycosyltransferase